MNTAAFTAVAGVVEWLAGVFSAAWQWITDGWNSFIALLTGFSPSQALSGMASGIVSLFDNVWQTIKGGFLKSWNWIVGKLNKIPGVDISLANESQPALTTNTRTLSPDFSTSPRHAGFIAPTRPHQTHSERRQYLHPLQSQLN